jgi:hypothetical protein
MPVFPLICKYRLNYYRSQIAHRAVILGKSEIRKEGLMEQSRPHGVCILDIGEIVAPYAPFPVDGSGTAFTI